MNKRPKVSVLIPVYNVENYICDCMDSVVNQTFKDIEIICVNDCSTDSSMQILQQYAENDDRVVLIDKKQNEGLLMARKSGVEAATGEYILFVDSDDYIDLNLCQFVNDITEKEDADIIHFSSGVDAEDSDKNFEGVVNALKPLEKTLIGDEILDNAYIKMTYATQVWGKIYKTDLCKKVYAVLPDEHCYVGEDVFTTFFLSHFAKKYVGVKTPQYYFYRFGFGISGQSMISVKKFEMFAKMSNWIKYTQEYLDTNNANEIQQKACNAMKDRLFADGCEIYRVRVRDEDKGAAEELIYKYWKDIPLNDAAWIKHIGKTKDYI
ncbi:MAG: glycosyltransferase family 2 protein [Oscillospiraceae bacterium]|nr:glycosyltransferase family 2 protein [Oscillospiraceae bacterium]